uniref:hypothetical protein n=1 Tax=Escherichia coli TaxID=562 RepID=UPI0014595A38|nr:hypothetical protein [Escherichia coli]
MRVVYDKLKILFVINKNVLIFIKNQVTTDMGAFLVVYHCNRSQCEKRTPILIFHECIDQKKFSLIGVELNIIQVICIFIVRNAEENIERHMFLCLYVVVVRV